MSKILHFFNILFLYIGCFVFFLFFTPSFTVKASDSIPHVNTGSLSYSALGNGQVFAGDFSPYGVYVLHDTDNGVTSRKELLILSFNCDGNVSYTNNSVSAYPTVSSGSYYYDSHLVKWVYSYCSWYDWHNGNSYDFNITGTELLNYNQDLQGHAEDVCNFFLFGVGSFDYVKPAEDIEDSDLDIVGLIGSFSTSLDSDPTTFKGFMSNFLKNIANMFTGGIFAGSSGGNNIFVSQNGSTVSSVPSCRLVWDSPEVSNISNYSDPSAVSYSIWIDGSSTVTLFQVGEWVDDASCPFNHLLLNDEPIVYNGTGTFYYSTGSDYETILNYVLNNSSFGGGSSFDESKQSDIKLDTTISRIYIQAHRTDDNGDNHVGAISYVDFSTGYPVVYEGVSDSISDISPDDSGNGTTTIVTQPFTVSGDNIVYGDTITENNTTNNYYGEGLIIGGNIPFLNAAYWLIQAVLELIKTLYASLLVPFIVLGWTGHL